MNAKRTHLYSFHKANGRLIEFASFELPILYEGIVSEHLTVRNGVGIFDVTHMGRTLISGSDSIRFLDKITGRDPSTLAPLQSHYSVICNEHGGIKDDIRLYRLAEDNFLIVYNASNRLKIIEWLKMGEAKYSDLKVQDISDVTPMFAVQGPNAQATLQKLFSIELSQIKRFWGDWGEVEGVKIFISRTGYTGEDGFELYLWNIPMTNVGKAVKIWDNILSAGQEFGIKPCGLGARDTLRLEAGMCLYGQDISEEITPLEARIEFTVRFDERDFIGRDALLKQKEEGVNKIRVGLKMVERIPRKDYEIFKDDDKIGYVSSGTFSPLLGYGIAMGYIPPKYAQEGEFLTIKIKDKMFQAEIVKWPFYDTEKYGWSRKNIKRH